MLERCYSKDAHINFPSYKSCTVSEVWYNYQNFAEWMSKQGKPDDFEIDKDILVKNNKVYSPDFCRLVPREINSTFIKRAGHRGSYPIGVHESGGKFIARLSYKNKRKHLGVFDSPTLAFCAYKEVKERLIKYLANKYKNVIDQDLFESMLEYEVSIED